MSQSSVAVIGASGDRNMYGNMAVRAYLESGFKVYPINQKEDVIEGEKAYKSLREIPDPVDFVSLYVPPVVGIKLLPDIADMNPKELWLNPGSESEELIEMAADLHIRTLVACSISALGMDPEEFPDA